MQLKIGRGKVLFSRSSSPYAWVVVWMCVASGALAQQITPSSTEPSSAAEQGSVTIRLKLMPSTPDAAVETAAVPEAQADALEIGKQPAELSDPVAEKASTEGLELVASRVDSEVSGQPLRKPGVPKFSELTLFDPFEPSDATESTVKLELAPDPLSLPMSVGTGSDYGSYARYPRSFHGGRISLKNGNAQSSQAVELKLAGPPTSLELVELEHDIASDRNQGDVALESHSPPERILASNDRALALGSTPEAEDAMHERADQLSARGTPTECPGAPSKLELALESQPDDVTLEQNEHPYDAPAARSTPSKRQSREISDTSTINIALRRGINECLSYYLTHPENVAKRGPWALMHAALPFGVETEVIAGNRSVNAIGWMCYNGVCAKQRMFQATKQGFRTNVGPGVQGHEGQFLAILAQSKVQSDYPIVIGNRRYTIADLVRYEMATCREKSELTFKLIGLSHYLEPNQRWRDNRGQTWNLEKMVAEELAQPVVGAACGGSHRLMGLSFAIIKRQQAGLPIEGHWKRAEIFLNDYVNYAMSLQNPNGSFSTEWFEGRGNQADVERQVQTTGHILEWLVFTLPDEHLQSPRIEKSIQFLLDSIGQDPSRNWPIGPRGHALRALSLYNQRVFGAEVGNTRGYVAEVLNAPMKR